MAASFKCADRDHMSLALGFKMAVFHVATQNQLAVALSRVRSGDWIQLRAGNYGDLNFYNKNFAGAVTIAGPTTGPQAHFNNVKIDNVNNLVLTSLDIGRTLGPQEPEWTALSRIRNSSNITLNDVNIHGSLDGNPWNDGVGLILMDSRMVKIQNSEFQELFRGIQIIRGSDISIKASNYHDIRSDGIQSAAADRVLIERNLFTDFYAKPGDHADAIQFFNLGQPKGASDITIRGNVMLQGEGTGFQGIWISDGQQHGYRNIHIDSNLVYSNKDWNGISVKNARDVRITWNTVVSETVDREQLRIRIEDSVNVYTERNVADQFYVSNVVGHRSSNDISLLSLGDVQKIFPEINAGPDVDISGLIMRGYGYQHPVNFPIAFMDHFDLP